MMVNSNSIGNIPSNLQFEHLSFTPIPYAWVPVLSSMDTLYHFPEPITAFMRSALRRPAIYRWEIAYPDGTTEYYVGETKELCPRRINHYLRPGPTQMTNLRLNERFSSLTHQGCTVTIDCLHFEPFSVGDIVVTQDSLIDNHIRRFLEELFIVLMKRNGDTLLNR